ncbi:TPA: hypothetical protein ACU22X_002921, partial [Salmonella enterica]
HGLFSFIRLIPSAKNIQNAAQSMNLIAGLIQQNDKEGDAATNIYVEMGEIAKFIKIVVRYG